MGGNPLLGVFFHWLGGLSSASFYVPYKRIRGWSWEIFWLVGGLFSWAIAPWLVASLQTERLLDVLADTPSRVLFWCWFWGAMWGLGGLTFGLAMRYLGLSLGMAVTLGLCAVFGTVVPPLWKSEFAQLLGTPSGRMILIGLAVCVMGILICGVAGMMKEKSLSTEQKQASIAEFDLRKGLLVAVFSGIMSACMSFGLDAGQGIADLAVQHGTDPLYKNNAILVVVLLGGL